MGGENAVPGTAGAGGAAQVQVQAPPLPRLQIVRRRRETSGGEMSTGAVRKAGGGEAE